SAAEVRRPRPRAVPVHAGAGPLLLRQRPRLQQGPGLEPGPRRAHARQRQVLVLAGGVPLQPVHLLLAILIRGPGEAVLGGLRVYPGRAFGEGEAPAEPPGALRKRGSAGASPSPNPASTD